MWPGWGGGGGVQGETSKLLAMLLQGIRGEASRMLSICKLVQFCRHHHDDITVIIAVKNHGLSLNISVVSKNQLTILKRGPFS